VGRQLTEVYWRHGNGVAFLDLVRNMTDAPLTGAAWVAALREPLEDKVASEKKAFDAGLKARPPAPRRTCRHHRHRTGCPWRPPTFNERS